MSVAPPLKAKRSSDYTSMFGVRITRMLWHHLQKRFKYFKHSIYVTISSDCPGRRDS